MPTIEEKLQNVNLLIKEIESFPQTYSTLLKEHCGNTTCSFLLRKRLNQLTKLGKICKAAIVGTRFGMAIFYTIPKQYHIIIESSRIGSIVNIFFKYREKNEFIIFDEYWILEKGQWVKYGKEKFIMEGNILRWF